MVMLSFDQLLNDPSERELNETILNKIWNLKLFRAYINDLNANPLNSLAKWDNKGILDPNRSQSGQGDPSYPASAILYGIFDTFDFKTADSNVVPDLQTFFEVLRSRDDSTSINQALENLAYATSYTVNKNLTLFFNYVLKFDISENLLSGFPSIQPNENKLIRDQSTLWFLSPFEEIPLNLRSISHGQENTKYRIVYSDSDEIISESSDGNNF